MAKSNGKNKAAGRSWRNLSKKRGLIGEQRESDDSKDPGCETEPIWTRAPRNTCQTIDTADPARFNRVR